MTDLETIEQAIILLKAVKSSLVKREKLSAKTGAMNPTNSTPKRIDNATACLNWECMEYSKSKVNFARLFKGSVLDVSTAVQTYRPSPFQEYTH